MFNPNNIPTSFINILTRMSIIDNGPLFNRYHSFCSKHNCILVFIYKSTVCTRIETLNKEIEDLDEWTESTSLEFELFSIPQETRYEKQYAVAAIDAELYGTIKHLSIPSNRKKLYDNQKQQSNPEIVIQIENTTAYVFTPYNPEFVNRIKRELPGARWNSERRSWQIPSAKIDEARNILYDIYGYNDKIKYTELNEKQRLICRREEIKKELASINRRLKELNDQESNSE